MVRFLPSRRGLQAPQGGGRFSAEIAKAARAGAAAPAGGLWLATATWTGPGGRLLAPLALRIPSLPTWPPRPSQTLYGADPAHRSSAVVTYSLARRYTDSMLVS